MFNKLRSMISTVRGHSVVTAVPPGERVYAVGDVHGRNDLLKDLIALVESDDRARGPADTTVIMLGDLVDRGPDSAGVFDTARAWAARRKVRFLIGNHEDMFLNSFTNPDVLRNFIRVGGRETLLSYPFDRDTYHRATIEELQQIMPLVVPQADIAFMQAMENLIRIGDYVFVHAGIRPGIAIEDQNPVDLRWIRGEFIDDRTPRDFAVVHGHTITEQAEVMPMRIGIDTGAFASGRLTALGLEGTARWLIATTPPES